MTSDPSNQSHSRTRPIAWLAIAALAFSLHLALRAPPPEGEPPPPDSALSLFAGAFRPLAADVLWARLESYDREGRPEEMVPVARLLLALDPRSQGAWFELSAAIGTDVPAFEDDPDVVWRWKRQGLRILEEGARRNPGSWFLRHRAGLFLEHQVLDRPGLAERFQRDSTANPSGLSARDAALQLYRAAQAVPGHAPYVDEAVRRLSRDPETSEEPRK